MNKHKEKLLKLMVENPDLELKIFVHEDANIGEFGYEESEITSVDIETLYFYDGNFIVDEFLERKIIDSFMIDTMTGYYTDAKFDDTVNSLETKNFIVVYIG